MFITRRSILRMRLKRGSCHEQNSDSSPKLIESAFGPVVLEGVGASRDLKEVDPSRSEEGYMLREAGLVNETTL